MEVDEAIKGCDDRRLRTKYSNAIYVIQRALALYRTDELAFSFNGGKDSTVLLHLLRAAYFLHEKERKQSNGNLVDNGYTFSMRTIYFERPSTFPEINSFTHETATTYRLHLDIITQDFKSGLEALLKSNPIRAIFLGVRTGDPTAVGQEQFSPTSPGWPPFMRVNPILDWSYRDVWAFLLKCKAPYCSLYDQGYTSIGSIHDTVPNSQLRISNPTTSQENYRPAYLLSDGRLERAGRAKKPLEVHGNVRLSNGLESLDTQHISVPKASVIGVGDEILFGAVEDFLGPLLCKKLHSIGWSVTKLDIVQSDVDSVAEAVERQKSENDMVFVYGGVGHMQSDATLSGVAKAFGVRLAPVEEFEEHINCIESHNGMAQLPEGITELLHHANLPVPLMKCQNVIIFGACNPSELNNEWKCLMEPAKSRMELAKSSGFLKLAEPFVSKCLTTKLSDREVAQPLLALHTQFPDIFISCYRKSRKGPLVIFIEGKDQARVKSAMEAFRLKFQPQPGLLDCFLKITESCHG